MPELRPGKVYVIENGQGLVKVGKAADPEQRRKSLEQGLQQLGQTLRLVYCTVERPDVGTVERLAHESLSEQRVRGEWFKVSPERAIEAINSAFVQLEEAKRCSFCWPIRRPFRSLAWARSRAVGGRGAQAAVKFDMRADPQFLRKLDEIRQREADIPSRAEMVRRLVTKRWEGEKASS